MIPAPEPHLPPTVLMCPSVCSFHDDVPKDYRQVSLTAVKQRFEDKRYEEISREEVPLPPSPIGQVGPPPLEASSLPLTLASSQVLSYGQVCAALGVKQESPEPASFLSTGDIHAFLSSPSARRTKRLVIPVSLSV